MICEIVFCFFIVAPFRQLSVAVKMNLTREHFRSMIFYDFRCGLSQQECFQRLQLAFGDEAPCRSSVYSWFGEFRRGRDHLHDEIREGRPVTAVTESNIDTVRQLIESDKKITCQQIRTLLGIGMSQVQNILHVHLKVRKLCTRWIPHDLTEDQKRLRVQWCRKMIKKFNGGQSLAVYNIVTGDETWVYCFEPERKSQSAEWVFPFEDLPTKVKKSRSIGKQMVASFFGKSGHYTTVSLENQRTVTADWYVNTCLPRVLEKVREKRPRSNVVLHHDNASSHSAKVTEAYLKASNVELMTHPPYSPDLAPCDFFLFPKIKDKLRGIRFTSPESAVNAFKEAIEEVPKEDWSNCFVQWFQRMQKCINCGGIYFEKQ